VILDDATAGPKEQQDNRLYGRIGQDKVSD
jgi:hypothetical protein